MEDTLNIDDGNLCMACYMQQSHWWFTIWMQVKNLEDRSALKLLLLFEFGRGNDSLWAPYIKRLADHIDTRVGSPIHHHILDLKWLS